MKKKVYSEILKIFVQFHVAYRHLYCKKANPWSVKAQHSGGQRTISGAPMRATGLDRHPCQVDDFVSQFPLKKPRFRLNGGWQLSNYPRLIIAGLWAYTAQWVICQQYYSEKLPWRLLYQEWFVFINSDFSLLYHFYMSFALFKTSWTTMHSAQYTKSMFEK